MTPEDIEAARKLLEWPSFPGWQAGMVDTDGRILVVMPDGCEGWCDPRDGSVYHVDMADLSALPDLTHPATLGCLLALVREWYNDPGIHLEPFDVQEHGPPIRWFVYPWRYDGPARCPDSNLLACADTEGQALVAALLAAPEKA